MHKENKCKLCVYIAPQEEQDLYLYAMNSLQFRKQSDVLLSKISFKTFQQSQKFDLKEVLDKKRLLGNSIGVILQASLYKKYSASSNYFYARDIKAIQTQLSCRSYVYFKEMQILDTEEESLKRSYQLTEIPAKLKMLGEYYKFHKDTPRMFMVPFSDIINRYLDQMRKVDYYKIAKIIAQENRANPNRPPKGIIGEIPSPLHTVDQGGNREKKNQEAFSRILLGLMEESAKKCSDEVSVTVQDLCENIQMEQSTSRAIENELMGFDSQYKKEEMQKFRKFQGFVEKMNGWESPGSPQKFRIMRQSPGQTSKQFQQPKSSLKLNEGLKSIRQVVIRQKNQMRDGSPGVPKLKLQQLDPDHKKLSLGGLQSTRVNADPRKLFQSPSFRSIIESPHIEMNSKLHQRYQSQQMSQKLLNNRLVIDGIKTDRPGNVYNHQNEVYLKNQFVTGKFSGIHDSGKGMGTTCQMKSVIKRIEQMSKTRSFKQPIKGSTKILTQANETDDKKNKK